jgi:hypothetical protein
MRHATAQILTPALPSTPAANCNSHIFGLLDELRQRFDRIPVVPGASVSLPSADLQELKANFMEASIAIRNVLRWGTL